MGPSRSRTWRRPSTRSWRSSAAGEEGVISVGVAAGRTMSMSGSSPPASPGEGDGSFLLPLWTLAGPGRIGARGRPIHRRQPEHAGGGGARLAPWDQSSIPASRKRSATPSTSPARPTRRASLGEAEGRATGRPSTVPQQRLDEQFAELDGWRSASRARSGKRSWPWPGIGVPGRAALNHPGGSSTSSWRGSRPIPWACGERGGAPLTHMNPRTWSWPGPLRGLRGPPLAVPEHGKWPRQSV